MELVDYFFLHTIARVTFSTHSGWRIETHIDDFGTILVVLLGEVQILVIPTNHLQLDNLVVVQLDEPLGAAPIIRILYL